MNSVTNSRLCQILSVLPATSVDCKRGFSKLNHIKTDIRKRLQDENLKSTFRISATSMSVVELRPHEKNSFNVGEIRN